MVGTLAVRYPDLDKTLWIHCNDEGISVSSADFVWNEDHSESWARYEDVSLLELDFWEHSPKDAGALFPAIQDAVTYTIQQAVQNSNRPFHIPAKWLPEAFCQTTDAEYIKWAVEVEHAVEVGKEGVIINDPKYLFRNAPQAVAPGIIAYIASPLSGNIDENLQFARKACGYAAMQAFAVSQPEGDLKDRLTEAVSAGGMRRFRNVVEDSGILDVWKSFRQDFLESEARAWCEANGVPISE